MKLLSLAVALVLPFTSLAAKRSTGDVFSTYHSKSLSTPSLKLDDGIFDELTALPRNHSVLVCLTALDARFGCKMCQDFKPEWELLAKSWIKGDRQAEGKLLFGQLDFANGRKTFESMQLQTAPILMFYPPTTGPNAQPNARPAKYEFSAGNPSADAVHAWLNRQLPAGVPKPAVYRPFNYVRFITLTTMVLGGLTGAFVAWPYVLPIVQNRNLWAAISVILVLLFTSGYMFNHIRSTPYVGGDGKGQISYFAGGFQNQFGLESQIVAGMYAVLAFATISLALKVPRMTNPKAQQVAVFVWGAVIFGMYGFLLSVFRTKNGGYPFSLPPF